MTVFLIMNIKAVQTRPILQGQCGQAAQIYIFSMLISIMAIFSYIEPLTSTILCTSLLVISQTSLSSELIMYVNLSASHIFTKEGLILDNSCKKDSLTVTYLLFRLHINRKWNSSSNMLQCWHTQFSTGIFGRVCLRVSIFRL